MKQNSSMKRFFSITLLFFLALVSVPAFAQSVTVSGTVKDAKGEGVIGAGVRLSSDKTVGVVTDLEGNYSIDVPASSFSGGGELEVSCMSYQTVVEKIGRRARIDFVLRDDVDERWHGE